MYFVKPEDLGKFKAELPELDEEPIDYDVEHPVSQGDIPSLNILILIVGSRGDVQPFIAFGKGLVKAGHRVRLATHVNFRDFVTDNGLEFYPLGGNPEHLMNFMVNHPDMITLDPNEISKNKTMMEEIYHSTWDACIGLGFHPDVLISNPPVHVHVHLAQRLQIPLFIMFTMPWSATKDYMHPLAPYQHLLENFTSYNVVDRMIWVGLGGVINEFRKKIGLPTISGGASLVSKLKVPQVYCMSPHLAPKPTDWGTHIDVVGFWYLDLVSNYKPPQDLLDFLAAGEPPVYVGFGSIVVDNPKLLSKNIIDGIVKSGKRALVSPGWAKLGEGMALPPNIKLIGAVPHDWLFTKCAAVIHHGGAGTTAAGLKSGCPTFIVPFFGDQPFWGACVARMGVGPDPTPHKHLNADKVAEAILFMARPETVTKAKELGQKLTIEDGVEKAVEVFQRRLPIVEGVWEDEIHENMRKIPPLGWVHKTFPNERASYTDRTGIMVLDLDRYSPHAGWEWIDKEWTPKVIENVTDSEGWRYGPVFGTTGWNSHETGMDFVRTRKLVRRKRHVGIKENPSGKRLLYIDVIEAKGLPSLDMIGKSDPYCEIVCAESKVAMHTGVVDDNNDPVWKQTLWFEVEPTYNFTVSVYDKDPVGKEFIGSASVSAKHAIDNDKKEDWVPLVDRKSKEVGKIHLKYFYSAK